MSSQCKGGFKLGQAVIMLPGVSSSKHDGRKVRRQGAVRSQIRQFPSFSQSPDPDKVIRPCAPLALPMMHVTIPLPPHPSGPSRHGGLPPVSTSRHETLSKAPERDFPRSQVRSSCHNRAFGFATWGARTGPEGDVRPLSPVK